LRDVGNPRGSPSFEQAPCRTLVNAHPCVISYPARSRPASSAPARHNPARHNPGGAVVAAGFLPVRFCWCSRQSVHTQPLTYAALVPCSKSSRRAAVSAASSAVDHSWSVFVSPHTCCEVRPSSVTTDLNGVRIYALEKSLSDFGGEPCLRIDSPTRPFRVSVRLTAGRASTAARPSRTRAMP
jgi:hypothetical protein